MLCNIYVNSDDMAVNLKARTPFKGGLIAFPSKDKHRKWTFRRSAITLEIFQKKCDITLQQYINEKDTS